MTTNTRILAIVALVTSTAAFAHGGVQNPAVKARMDAMSVIADNTKLLGTMAKGAVAFDAAAARDAAATIAEQADRTPVLFSVMEDDPKSEASSAIWQAFDDFTAKSETLGEVATQAAMGIETPDDLRAALGRIGTACKSCHSLYRE